MTKTKVSIPLFYHYMNEEIKRATYKALGEERISQGKTVDDFEKKLKLVLGVKNVVTVNSGTSALELAYRLPGLKLGDEVITPDFLVNPRGRNV